MLCKVKQKGNRFKRIIKNVEKRSVNMYFEERTIAMLDVVSAFENRSKSEIIEDLIKTYVVLNKHKINAFIEEELDFSGFENKQ